MDPKTAAKWMEEAFALALQARGTTLPNPAVGCIVLDKSGKKIASAATSKDGRPHAERKALEQAGAKARGGTLVVTLEPCVAFPGKKSPPCAAAAIVSGIETVIVGATDPNPQVGGKGLHALRKSGMSVVECPLEGKVPGFYAGFGHFLATGRPRLTVKVAVSADGNLAAAPGQRTHITGDESRRFVHALRAQSDAILIGGRTALADDPELTVRDAPGRSPHRLVLWPSSGLPDTLKIWSDKAPVTVFGTTKRPPNLPAQAQWVELPPSADAKLDLTKLLDWCGTQGMHEVLVEPGQNLLGSLLERKLWDALWILRSKTPLPGGVPADLHGRFPASVPLIQRQFGDDVANFWENDQKLPLSPLS